MKKKEKIKAIIKEDSTYNIQNNAVCFLTGDRLPNNTAGDSLLGKFQHYLKGYGRLYYFLVSSFSPVTSSSRFRKTIQQLLTENTEEQ